MAPASPIAVETARVETSWTRSYFSSGARTTAFSPYARKTRPEPDTIWSSWWSVIPTDSLFETGQGAVVTGRDGLEAGIADSRWLMRSSLTGAVNGFDG